MTGTTWGLTCRPRLGGRVRVGHTQTREAAREAVRRRAARMSGEHAGEARVRLGRQHRRGEATRGRVSGDLRTWTSGLWLFAGIITCGDPLAAAGRHDPLGTVGSGVCARDGPLFLGGHGGGFEEVGASEVFPGGARRRVGPLCYLLMACRAPWTPGRRWHTGTAGGGSGFSQEAR